MQNHSTVPSRSHHLHHVIVPLQSAVLDTAVMRTIRSESIRLRHYITLLHALRGVHASMDARLPELPLRLPIAPLRRLPALDADLRTWDPAFVLTTPPEEPRIAGMDTLGLVGALFAMESLRQANADTVGSLARTFAVSTDTLIGLSYHSAPDPLEWQQCLEAVDRLPLTAEQEHKVTDGATICLEAVLACYHSIEPY